ncbi:Zn-dependent protease with chaperone function [Amaricoccus macauensis]|uniref:Zn-dependent protease with chaperone function n=1 Tax=Amaricoccus macauensis TaxID=57001 RepID=A0A840SHM2_9RHOB|nr:M48 family metallopeptidase [Amaricoccus macauensis]MBB5220434.1 Zn-dependent protease with chaperone function [Amaricoccus macauensis]
MRTSIKYVVISALGFLSACGTAYQMPALAEAELVRANSVIARESAAPVQPVGIFEAVDRFDRVAQRIEPYAEAACRRETPERDCDLAIRVDLDPRSPANAFQTVNSDGPLIIVTGALLQGTKNDDEVAFVMGHEAGHHIARHLEKHEQQQLAGALILGAAAAYAGAGTYQTQYQARQNIENAMNIGAAFGGMAYSQTYELEADMLGAYIAEAAGYDAEKGSLLFARREGGNTGGANGAMSLWSTHPRSPERVATVRYAVADARAKKASGQTLRPEWKGEGATQLAAAAVAPTPVPAAAAPAAATSVAALPTAVSAAPPAAPVAAEAVPTQTSQLPGHRVAGYGCPGFAPQTLYSESQQKLPAGCQLVVPVPGAEARATSKTPVAASIPAAAPLVGSADVAAVAGALPPLPTQTTRLPGHRLAGHGCPGYAPRVLYAEAPNKLPAGCERVQPL